jgi:hypothetical protein
VATAGLPSDPAAGRTSADLISVILTRAVVAQ